MNEELDEFMFLYENFFDKISQNSQKEIRKKLIKLLRDFQDIVKKETL